MGWKGGRRVLNNRLALIGQAVQAAEIQVF